MQNGEKDVVYEFCYYCRHRELNLENVAGDVEDLEDRIF
jgi:hypothetical protein